MFDHFADVVLDLSWVDSSSLGLPKRWFRHNRLQIMLYNMLIIGCSIAPIKSPRTMVYKNRLLYIDDVAFFKAQSKRTSQFLSSSEGEVAFFSAKRWDRRNREDLIESATPCHDAQVVGPYRDSNPLRLTTLDAMSEDYTTVPQHLQAICMIKTHDSQYVLYEKLMAGCSTVLVKSPRAFGLYTSYAHDVAFFVNSLGLHRYNKIF